MGRPKKFNEEEALEKAMELFWRKGYEAASVQDLVEHVGIHRGSLYGTFGGKRRLFRAAMDRYCHRVIRRLFGTLDRPGSARDALRRFFGKLVERAESTDGARGCLVTNTAVELAPHDREAAVAVREALAGMEDYFHKALIRARQEGEVGKRHDPRATARFLVGLLQAGIVLSKAGVGRQVLRDVVETGLSVLEK